MLIVFTIQYLLITISAYVCVCHVCSSAHVCMCGGAYRCPGIHTHINTFGDPKLALAVSQSFSPDIMRQILTFQPD